MAYAGQEAPIPLGQYGLITDMAPTDVPPGALINANNISLVEGTVQKAPGGIKYNASALPGGVVALFDWWPTTAVQRMIVACDNGKLYRDDGPGTFRTTLNTTSFGTLTPNSQFVAGGSETAARARKLFFFSFGIAPLKVLSGDGSTVSNIALPALDWTATNYPKCGVTHRNHLWAFAGQTAYGSNTANHEDFRDASVLIQPVFPGEGGDVIGSFVYKGRLFCWKNEGFCYWLDDSDTTSTNWNWKKLTSNFGLSAPNAICEVLDDMLSGSQSGGVTSFQATQSLGNVEAGDVFKGAQIANYVRANTSKIGVPYQHALYYPDKKQVFFTYRSGYATHNDTLIVMDVNKQNPRITFWRKGHPDCLALRKDAASIYRPMYGSSDGYVYLMDREDRLEGSVAYQGDFQTGHLDFAWLDGKMAAKQKHFDWLAVTYVPEGDHALSCDYYIDGKYIDTITFKMCQYTKPQLNTFTLNTDRLVQANTETSIRPLAGSGRVISFRFYNAGSNQSFQVARIVVGFRPGGENAQKTE